MRCVSSGQVIWSGVVWDLESLPSFEFNGTVKQKVKLWCWDFKGVKSLIFKSVLDIEVV